MPQLCQYVTTHITHHTFPPPSVCQPNRYQSRSQYPSQFFFYKTTVCSSWGVWTLGDVSPAGAKARVKLVWNQSSIEDIPACPSCMWSIVRQDPALLYTSSGHHKGGNCYRQQTPARGTGLTTVIPYNTPTIWKQSHICCTNRTK